MEEGATAFGKLIVFHKTIQSAHAGANFYRLLTFLDQKCYKYYSSCLYIFYSAAYCGVGADDRKIVRKQTEKKQTGHNSGNEKEKDGAA